MYGTRTRGVTNIAPTFHNIVTVQPYASAALSPKEGMTAKHVIGGWHRTSSLTQIIWFGHKTSVDILEDRKFLAASVNGAHGCPAHETDKSPGPFFTVEEKVNKSHYRTEIPRGFQEVKVPRLRDNGPEWWEGCQPYAPAAFLPPGNTPGTHFC